MAHNGGRIGEEAVFKFRSSANAQLPIKDKTVHYLFIRRFFANTVLWAGRVKENDYAIIRHLQ
jgi:hypothetical protein